MNTAVLLPGTLCDARIFGEISPHLAKPLFLDIGAYEAASDAARSVIDEVPPNSVGIAFSLGSWVLLEMLRIAPARFRSIILLSGNAHPDAPDNAAMRLARVQQAAAFGYDALFAEEWPLMLGAASHDDDAMRTLITDMAAATGHVRHARQAALNSTRPDLRDLVAQSPVPIHVIAGAQDGLCPRERYEMAASGPVSSLTILDEVGHYVPLEAPDRVLEILKHRNPEALL